MEIRVDMDLLKKQKLFVAAPMYGGQCAGMFCRSTNDLSAVAVHYGIDLRMYYLFNESLITRARNYCVDEFLRSDCTHMLFIDSDIGFNSQDVIAMLALMTQEDNDYDILCAPYPKKCIAWEKIKIAVDKGFADDDANNLEKYVGDYVFNPVGNKNEIPIGEPVEVLESGTGFMMIKRETFEKYAAAYPQFYYKPDHVRTANFDGSREIMAYFDCIIDPKTKRYLSEDYMFCQHARDAGLKVWLCPWIQLQHVGSYIFGGSLADLASIGAAATVDPAKLGKKK